jgi:hypothetical protein
MFLTKFRLPSTSWPNKLTKVAAIVAEIAQTFPSAADLRFCPHPPGTPAAKIWLELELRWLGEFGRQRVLKTQCGNGKLFQAFGCETYSGSS